MRKPLHTQEHERLRTLLRDERRAAKLTQQTVADRLQVPQSFVAKYEGGERRLDVLEFINVARALNLDPVQVLQKML